MPDELGELRARVHGGITSFDFEGTDVPCIMVDGPGFGRIVSMTAGRPPAVETGLNILDDGLGHAFVEVALSFPGAPAQKYLVDARRDIRFFELLAESGMLALLPESGGGSVFMIQLPRPERARDALALIRRALGNAVTGI